ncbi:restriction endonuclease subunit S [Myroides marinus]|uniref:restriction endonuclease subunit S n=1 Tax=Myroides marinus TaxID=703342 RepID=UPI002575B760|nr:restriction endonuclease subunit S [Myroides marinus]MDM1362500.1 restriction endonuclease subunit S [Myroides marinus]
MDFKINKNNWERVTLGDVVFEPKETAKDIIAEGYEHIVGLEHISSGDVHLRNSFSNDTDTTFTKVFRAGDILFGRRRAYLKKAAQAYFDGVCSGDITVMRANDKLDVRLLPFVIQNDNFFDYAVKHSAGGLSPRVKFKDLANYEFLLPPKEQQAELADLLWAMDDVIEKDLEVLDSYNEYFLTEINTKTSSKNSFCNNEYLLKELGETFNGLNGKTKEDFGQGEKYITYLNVYKNYEIDANIFDLVTINSNEKQNKVKYGDIIFTGSSETSNEVGITSVVLSDIEYYLNSFCFGFRLNDFEILEPRYAKFLFRNHEIRHFLNLRAQGSTRFNLSKTDLKNKLVLKIPNIDKQIEIYENLNRLEKNIIKIESKLQSSKALQKALINQIF